ncbi:hypothetical protein SAMN05444340_101209 [Citreimonas salinaria]|uniref:Uncharacterized protein n=1 Tax=Citreimonas salinaria TaxID=321339 RepID=A0A1H3F7X7_9RHOB|nr:hypothetical protein SAMN05444340_101209 [Citreimonas salinaria]
MNETMPRSYRLCPRPARRGAKPQDGTVSPAGALNDDPDAALRRRQHDVRAQDRGKSMNSPLNRLNAALIAVLLVAAVAVEAQNDTASPVALMISAP